MSFKVYLKRNIGYQIANIDQDLPIVFSVQTLQITDGLLKKGAYSIPLTHILFIQEV